MQILARNLIIFRAYMAYTQYDILCINLNSI